MAYLPAQYDLDTDKEKILALEYKVNTHSDTSMWISPVGHRGTLSLFTKHHPLRAAFVADDKASILVKLDDPSLMAIMQDIEGKVTACSPDPSHTSPLINRDASGRYPPSLKLKTRYTQWVDANTNESLTLDEALSNRRVRITSWCITVYRLNQFRGTWYYAVNLSSAKVSRAEDGSPTSGHQDFTKFL
jgi:hypothetical protein